MNKKEMQEVFDFAVMAHKNQFRKSMMLPYISHPLEVMKEIMKYGVVDHDMWKAALCHDILEDTDITVKQLEEKIGTRAVGIVEELTFIPENSQTHKSTQKQSYMDNFKSNSVQAIVIKVADRIVNTRDFLISSRDYAPKYFHKADSLFTVFERPFRDKLEDVFGGDSIEVMFKNYDALFWELREILKEHDKEKS